MTRWERLLHALGVTSSTFDVQHQSKFDLSPETWVRDRLSELRADDPAVQNLPCNRPCCQESNGE